MSSNNIHEKNIVLWGQDSYLFHSIVDNFAICNEFQNTQTEAISEFHYLVTSNKRVNFYCLSKVDQFNSNSTFDILIINSNEFLPSSVKQRAKKIINLVDYNNPRTEIILPPPLKLIELLLLIKQSVLNDNLFSAITGPWIYDEQAAIVLSHNQSVCLTEKENKIIHSIVMAGSKISLKDLAKKAWKHNDLCESSTIETHLYRLKNKLPENMLLFNNEYCLIKK